MGDKLKDRVALVTGASRGIGRAIALGLAAEGAMVILSGRNESALTQVAKEIQSAGGSSATVTADLESEPAVLALAAAVKNRFNRLDILINNAGITLSAKLEDTQADDWRRLMTVNALAPCLLCRELLPLLRKSPAGRIVNMSSNVGVKGYAHQTAYSASKHALRGFSIALADELRNTPIRVHVICPGGVETEMVTRVRPDIDPRDLIRPEEVAEWVVSLCAHQGNGVIDEIRIRRAASGPWF